MRAVFFGTPEIAVPALRALGQVAEIAGVVSQPDRPSGRGMKLRSPAVVECAQEMGLETFQPARVRDGSLVSWLSERQADVALVMAYGRILPAGVLEVPRLGCMNLHASLLPKYRGAAPIQRALMAGESETGVCLMKMDEQMDTGDVFAHRKLALRPDHDVASLSADLAHLAAELTREELPRYVAGELSGQPQDESAATYAPPVDRAESFASLQEPALRLVHLIRGLSPHPAVTWRLERADGTAKRLRVLAGRAEASPPPVPPSEFRDRLGGVSVVDGRIFVRVGDGWLEILQAQLEGKKSLPARDLVNGRAIQQDDLLSVPG